MRQSTGLATPGDVPHLRSGGTQLRRRTLTVSMALAGVLMNVPLQPAEVSREGIRELTNRKVQAARAEGKPFKLVARAKLIGEGKVAATVRPEQMAASDPLSNVRGTSLAIHFELDMMPGLTITSHRPNLQSTAYGLLADFINAVKT